ncbi:MAG: hypothetical protein Q9160_003177 [Pyrenula sp. 1 TL-2023]
MSSTVPTASGSHITAQAPHVSHDADILSISTINHAADRQTQIAVVPKSFLRQIFGLNPFKTSYFALFRQLNDFTSRACLVCGTLLAIAAGVPLPVIGVIFAKLIDSFPPSDAELNLRLKQLLGVATAYFAITWAWAICWSFVGENVSRRLREKTVERVLGMEMAFFDLEHADVTAQLTTDTQAVQIGTSEKAGLFIQSVSYFVAAFVVGFILNARLTAILFAAVIPIMTLVVCYGTRMVSHYSRKASEWTEKATLVAEEAIYAVVDIQAFCAAGRIAEQHEHWLRRSMQLGIRKSIWGAVMLGCVFCIAYSANALAFWYGSKMIASTNSTYSAGTIYAVVFLILDASFVISTFAPFVQTFALAAAAGRNIFAILDHPEAHINVYSSEGAGATRADLQGDVKFESVSFVYPARPAVRVMECFNARFEAGRVTGVCGSSGSGKSTLAAQLLRLYDPCSGRLTINGRNIRDFNVGSLRSHISVVDQNPIIFTGSILENIAFGLKKQGGYGPIDRAKCIEAAKTANAWPFIKTLPNGIDTSIGGAGGTQLSGGQKQRICLARALVNDPAILILDEFTSALDSVSENLILEALANETPELPRTTIVIAHRLATIKNADKIIYLQSGDVCEEGTHAELMDIAQGHYRSLVEAQDLHPLPPDEHEEFHFTEIGSPLEKQMTEAFPETVEESDESTIHRSTFDLIARCVDLSRGEWLYIYIGLLAAVLSGGIVVGEAVVFGNLISVLTTGSKPADAVNEASRYCIVFLALAICAFIAYIASGTCFGIVSENLVLKTRDISLRTILQQDVDWFSRSGNSAPSLIAGLSTDAGHLSGLSGVIIGTVFSGTTSVFGGIILAHIVAWKIAIVLLAAVPIMLLAGFFRLRVLANIQRRHETAYNSAAALASEACSKIRTVASLSQERPFVSKYREAIKAPYRASIKQSLIGNLLLAFSLAITYFVYALAYWWGSRLVRQGQFTTLQFFIALPALLFSAQACGQMFSLAPELTRATSAARSVFRLHDQKPTIDSDIIRSEMGESSSDEPLPDEKSAFGSDNQIPPSRAPSIRFQNISLTYPSRPLTSALLPTTLEIERGKLTALVGPSGSGKSTIISLLMRFYDPDTGTITINGQDIRSMPVTAHRIRLGLVPQEPRLFSGSINFNIAIGTDSYSTDVPSKHLERLCQAVGIHEFIMGLPEGYETDIGKNGEKLSGGQRQRLALARAAIKDPEILLLDEASSQLDAHSEKAVMEFIRSRHEGKGEKTTIMVAHRLANVQYADRICVFDKGRLVDTGTHIELLGRGGLYREMVEGQSLKS